MLSASFVCLSSFSSFIYNSPAPPDNGAAYHHHHNHFNNEQQQMILRHPNSTTTNSSVASRPPPPPYDSVASHRRYRNESASNREQHQVTSMTSSSSSSSSASSSDDEDIQSDQRIRAKEDVPLNLTKRTSSTSSSSVANGSLGPPSPLSSATRDLDGAPRSTVPETSTDHRRLRSSATVSGGLPTVATIAASELRRPESSPCLRQQKQQCGPGNEGNWSCTC